jgi:hypothetical protein
MSFEQTLKIPSPPIKWPKESASVPFLYRVTCPDLGWECGWDYPFASIDCAYAALVQCVT